MVTAPALQAFLDWVDREPSIRAVTLFGTQAQGRAAAGSDFDLQIVTAQPVRFEDRRWTSAIPAWSVRAYAVRDATGGARKVTLLLEGAEFRFNSGLERTVEQPADGIRDGREERFVLEIPRAEVAGASSVEVSLYDAVLNRASVRLTW